MEFCVECGAEEDLFGHLCRKCLLSKEPIQAPKHISFSICGGCGKVLRGSRWMDAHHIDAVRELLLKETVTRPEVIVVDWDIPDFEPEKGEHRLNCQVTAELGGDGFQVPFEILVKVRSETCNVCSRMRGDYYEAIVQLRGEPIERANQLLYDIIDQINQNDDMAFISKQENVTGGIDYYLGSVSAARTVAKRFKDSKGAGITESSSLIGKKEGRDLYRWTLLIRLPMHKTGDVVEYDGQAYVVESVRSNEMTIRHAHQGTKTRVQADDDLRSIAKAEELEDSVVVSVDEGTLQILDPWSLKTVTVSRPRDMDEIGESVKVARFKDSLIIKK